MYDLFCIPYGYSRWRLLFQHLRIRGIFLVSGLMMAVWLAIGQC